MTNYGRDRFSELVDRYRSEKAAAEELAAREARIKRQQEIEREPARVAAQREWLGRASRLMRAARLVASLAVEQGVQPTGEALWMEVSESPILKRKKERVIEVPTWTIVKHVVPPVDYTGYASRSSDGYMLGIDGGLYPYHTPEESRMSPRSPYVWELPIADAEELSLRPVMLQIEEGLARFVVDHNLPFDRLR